MNLSLQHAFLRVWSYAELESKLADIDRAIAQNDFRAANIRAGYVYVISNRGAFGDCVVRIALNRRSEPKERIDELGDASVPFRFDMHAIYSSQDAVSPQSELHAHSSALRVDWASDRKENFFASPADVRAVLSAKPGSPLEFAEHAESTEYPQIDRYWPEDIRSPQLSRANTSANLSGARHRRYQRSPRSRHLSGRVITCTARRWVAAGDAPKLDAGQGKMAESEGFEPPNRLPRYLISSQAPSTTRPALR